MVKKTGKQIESENPEYKIWLHKRLGDWVIDVTVKELKDGVTRRGQTTEIYNGSNYQHTVGVFWFLLDRAPLMLELAAEQIGQRHNDTGGE
jgi:hypothetical protein